MTQKAQQNALEESKEQENEEQLKALKTSERPAESRPDLRRRSSWPEKVRPEIGRAKAARVAVVSRFNRREHRLCYRLVDACEAGLAPVAHFSVP